MSIKEFGKDKHFLDEYSPMHPLRCHEGFKLQWSYVLVVLGSIFYIHQSISCCQECNLFHYQTQCDLLDCFKRLVKNFGHTSHFHSTPVFSISRTLSRFQFSK